MSHIFHDMFVFIALAIRSVFLPKAHSTDLQDDKKVIIIGNGPSLNKDRYIVEQNKDSADIYCVNYFVLDDLFFKLKPRFYVLADPVFWRNDVIAEVEAENSALIDRLLTVNWKMYLVFPTDGLEKFTKALNANKHINFVGVPENCGAFRTEALCLLAFEMRVATPIFINVLVLALWHAMVNKRKLIEIYGADFSSFKDYVVDQKTNELFSSFKHFYVNTQAQTKADQKYLGARKKKIHVRLHQNWLSFQQMYLLSLYARRIGIKITNRSAFSYLDCFDRQ